MSLVFWGRHILRLFKIDQDGKPQIMLELTAAIAVMLVFAYAWNLYLGNLTAYLFAFFLTGLVGAFFGFFRKNISPWLASTQKRTVILKGLTNQDTWLAAILVALIMSMTYSAIWQTGRMESWINTGGDFYSWIFNAEYHLGLIDPLNPKLKFNFFFVESDAFGTYALIALTALARGQLPYEAAPAVLVTFIVWFGTAVYYFVSRAFKFKFYQSLPISLSLCLGSLLNFIAMTGMFGHLFVLTLFIISLTQLINYNYNNFKIIFLVKKLFFPLFTIFLSYQAGYILYLSFITLTIFLLTFFSFKKYLYPRFLKSLYYSLIIVSIISAVCFIIMPGLSYHLFYRSIEVANQTLGSNLPLFNPLLFSGIPYPKSFYIPSDQIKYILPFDKSLVYCYLFFLFIVIYILILNYLHERKKQDISNNFKFIFVINLVFFISVIFYLTLYFLFGNIYRIWKFSCYTILPLSFIPLSMCFYTIKQYKFFLFNKIFTILILIIISIFSFNLFNINPIYHLYSPSFPYQPSYLFLVSLYNISNSKKEASFIFNYTDISLILLTASILSKNNNKIYFNPGGYFFNDYIADPENFSDKTFFISNAKFNGIINSSLPPLKLDFAPLNVYDYSALKTHGFVSISAYDDFFNWKISNFPVNYKFLVPSRLSGQDTIFSITLSQYQSFAPVCNQIEFGILGADNQIIWTKKHISDPTLRIPAELTQDGILEVYTKASFIKGAKCVFNIDRVTLDRLI
jgi:hypothetical protein